MTTEIQIKRSRSHLPQLRRVVSCIAQRLGMNGSDIKETEDAVSDVCLTSIDMAPECRCPNLCIRLTTCGTCLTVEITDPGAGPDCAYLDRWASSTADEGLAAQSTNGIELIRGEMGATVRITRQARLMGQAAAAAMYP